MDIKLVLVTPSEHEKHFKIELEGQLHKRFETIEDAEKYMERIRKILIVKKENENEQ